MIEHWSNNFPAMLRIEGGGGLPSNMASWSHTLPPPCQGSKQVDISLYHTQCISLPLHASFCHSPIPGSPVSARRQFSLLANYFYAFPWSSSGFATAEYFLSLSPSVVPLVQGCMPVSLAFHLSWVGRFWRDIRDLAKNKNF